MGRLAAADMIEHAELDTALRWHLTGNHYPPLPASLVEPARRAIDLAADEVWDEEVELPEGVTYRGESTASVHACVEGWHLGAFVDARRAELEAELAEEPAEDKEEELTMRGRRELSFDGRGINGPDEYRERVATFTSPEYARRYGRLFEAAPELRAAAADAFGLLDGAAPPVDDPAAWREDVKRRLGEALALARGED